jgi:hypothetical protein
MYKRLLIIVYCLFVVGVPAISQTTSSPASTTAVRVETPPIIDGLMNDDTWRFAAPVTQFTQREPKEGSPATERTEVRLVYDDRALYIGVWCFDTEPNKLTANELSRDFSYSQEDNVEIIFDTYRDLRSSFLFVTNPNGARFDALVTEEGNNINRNWNGVWDAQAEKNGEGWCVEIEIPFSTLRFSEDSVQIWGVNFERNIRRKREQVLWQGYSRNYELEQVSQAGLLLGLRNIHRGTILEVKPYVSGGYQQDVLPEKSSTTLTKAGLDMKYPLTQTLTLDVTFNTDFAQVEADRAQINLTRFPLFFSEKREFFLEGAGTFDLNFGGRPLLFYSRRIGLSNGKQVPIIAGARVVGKVDEYDIGVLNMQAVKKEEDPSTNFTAVRVKRSILNQSYLGIMLTNKQVSGGYNRGYGADANLRFSNILGDNVLEVGGAFAGTATPGLSGENLAYRVYVDFPNDLVDHFVGLRSVQQNFNPEMGFVSRRGKQLSWALKIAPRPGVFGIRRLEFKPVDVEYYWDVNNVPESAFWEWRPLGFTTESGEFFEFNIQRTFDRLDEDFDVFDSVIIPKGKYHYTHYEIQFETNSSRMLSGDVFYNWGDYYTGSRRSFSASGTLKANSHLSLSVDYGTNMIELLGGSFSTSELGGQIRYAFSTLLNTSLFVQWNNEDQQVNLNFRLHWIPKIGSDIFLVLNQLSDSSHGLRNSQATVLIKVAYRVM